MDHVDADGTLRQHTSGNKKAEEDANRDTEVKLNEIRETGNKLGSKVVDDLLSAVVDVKPKPPRNMAVA